MSNRSCPSGAAKKKLKKIRETESLKNVPKLTSFGVKSKPKDTVLKERMVKASRKIYAIYQLRDKTKQYQLLEQ